MRSLAEWASLLATPSGFWKRELLGAKPIAVCPLRDPWVEGVLLLVKGHRSPEIPSSVLARCWICPAGVCAGLAIAGHDVESPQRAPSLIRNAPTQPLEAHSAPELKICAIPRFYDELGLTLAAAVAVTG
jgi:hypothetical protein